MFLFFLYYFEHFLYCAMGDLISLIYLFVAGFLPNFSVEELWEYKLIPGSR